ncbi:MAG TPA: carboxypeptidase-like regulatory domain-containing protein, partial [Gemmatimonadaceae bacterium]|nr:carboxypeptidase-like regulatory domain-containing protein [Gemmatimonadaceae bacterium]
MSIKLAAIALVVMTFGAPLRAQTTAGSPGVLTGTLVDAQTGLPVAGAQVRLPDLHRVEVSHDDGTFELRNISPGTHALIVQRIGYRKITRSVNVTRDTAMTLRIELDPVALTLTPQIITGTISERSGEEVLSPTSVVSGRSLDR